MLDLTDQLRRYADAADAAAVDAATPGSTGDDTGPELSMRRRRPARRVPLLAAAAAVLLLVAGSVVLRSADDEDQQVTAAAPGGDAADSPAPGMCPTPSTDPSITDVQLAMPWPATTDLQLSTDERVRIVIDPDGPKRTTIDLADFDAPMSQLNLGDPTAVTMCDPFSGSSEPVDAPATLRDDPSTLPGPSLTLPLGGRWSVSIWSDPGFDVTAADLRAIAAGISWPAPTSTARDCASITGRGTASLTVTELPRRAAPEGGSLSELVGDSSAVAQFFRLADREAIEVLWFGADDPAAVIRSLTGDDAEQGSITGCVQDTDGAWIEGQVPVMLARVEDRIVVGGQFGADEAWIVTGAEGATESQVLDVARGLRP